MFADYGTPVVAVVGGGAEENCGGAGGIGIVPPGNDGVQYYYAHLQEIATHRRRVGRRGDRLRGRHGQRPAATPHLHFEMHPGGWGTSINPYDAVAPYC